MNMQYKYLILALAFAGISLGSGAQTYEKNQSISRSFGIGADTKVEVFNKYGNIHLIPWDKDSVRFEISITVTANRQAKVDRTFRNIDIEFKESSEQLTVYTTFDKHKSPFWKDVSDFAGIIFKGGADAKINYKVFLPSSIQLKIENKFGNFYAPVINGPIDILVANGDFKIEKLNGKSRIELSFGKGSINYLADAKLKLNYADLEIHQADSLNIESRSTTLNFGQVGEINTDSRSDKYYITGINKLKGSSSFTYFNIDKLYKEISVKTNYGDIRIDRIEETFQYINFVSDYTDIMLSLPRITSFNVEINYNRRVDLTLPDNFQSLNKKTINGSNSYFMLSGMIGEKSQSSAVMKISKNAGILNISYY